MAKTILHWKKSKAPNKIIVDDKMVTNSGDINEAMNKYLKEKPEKVIYNIPPP